LNKLDRFPDRLGLVCWASYEMHKEGGKLYYGIALLEGKGVKSNPIMAKQWLQLAANQGDKDAIDILSN
jgi:TPR repeat protein